jgi:transcriptional regulator with XRE-family HTH domain
MKKNQLTNLKFIPQMIRRMRKQKTWTMEDLANKAGVSQSIIARIETGKALPRWETLIAILDSLDVTIWEALLYEFQEEAIPAICGSIIDRLKGGGWKKKRLLKPRPPEDFHRTFSDYILQELDRELKGKLDNLSALPDTWDQDHYMVNGWLPEEVDQLVLEVTKRVRPRCLDLMLSHFDKAKIMVNACDRAMHSIRNPDFLDI